MRPLHERVTERRSKGIFHFLNDPSPRNSDDLLSEDGHTNSSGGHLVDDQCIDCRIDFDLAYTVFKNSTPRSLEVNKHLFFPLGSFLGQLPLP